MKIKNLLLLTAAVAMSATAVAQDLKSGEYAVQGDGVTPAIIGQPTVDHLFTRNTYADNGSDLVYDNVISFQANTPQVVAFWLDDDEIYTNATVQALTPVAYGEEGIPYSEITYNSGQFDIYLPMSMQLVTYKFEGEKKKVQYSRGDRMPYETTMKWEEKGETKTIDGIEYRAYTVVIVNMENAANHFSGNDEEVYAESGALKKDDAPLFYLAVDNANQAEVENHLPDMIIANQEFGIREGVRDGWAPNDYRFFYGTGGNNVEQRFQLYHRVALYGSVSVVENLAEKTISSVKYYNIAGMESNEPFEGVNIKVTSYNDGTTSTCKVIK